MILWPYPQLQTSSVKDVGKYLAWDTACGNQKCRDLFTVIPRFVIEQAQAAAVTIMFGDEAALQQFNSRPPSTPQRVVIRDVRARFDAPSGPVTKEPPATATTIT